MYTDCNTLPNNILSPGDFYLVHVLCEHVNHPDTEEVFPHNWLHQNYSESTTSAITATDMLFIIVVLHLNTRWVIIFLTFLYYFLLLHVLCQHLNLPHIKDMFPNQCLDQQPKCCSYQLFYTSRMRKNIEAAIYLNFHCYYHIEIFIRLT